MQRALSPSGWTMTCETPWALGSLLTPYPDGALEAYRVLSPGEPAFQRRPRGDCPGRGRGPTVPERTGQPEAVLNRHGLWLLVQGWSVTQVAEALERDSHTIGDWLSSFRRAGAQGLVFEHTGGSPRLEPRSTEPTEVCGAKSAWGGED